MLENAATLDHLTYAYHLIAHWKLDDHTYTHLSARASERSYYLSPFGLRFDEVRPDRLLEIDSNNHTILSGKESIVNQTAYQLHGSLYQAHPNVNSILHIHTPEIVAVSCHPEGLLPLSQWALHFYGQIGYYPYDSLVLKQSQTNPLISLTEESPVIFMRHHGVLIVGKTIWETLFYLYHLQKACETQLLALSQGIKPLIISDEIAQKANKDLLSFEEDLGWRDWCAWIRLLNQKKEHLFSVKKSMRYYGHNPYVLKK